MVVMAGFYSLFSIQRSALSGRVSSSRFQVSGSRFQASGRLPFIHHSAFITGVLLHPSSFILALAVTAAYTLLQLGADFRPAVGSNSLRHAVGDRGRHATEAIRIFAGG